MEIAMVSEHASPLATLGGVDAGGQNVHVAALSAAPGESGRSALCDDRPVSQGGNGARGASTRSM